VGNDEQAARLSGINSNAVVILAFVLAGACFGVSATNIATASQRVTATMGTGLEMTFIACCVLGGTSVAGGSGKIIGTVFGAAVLAIIPSAVNYMGISSDWSDAIKGAIIIVAVVVTALNLGKKQAPSPAVLASKAEKALKLGGNAA
jgi:ribose/xylose/arabinose/galactoside ABC-type transport system permease subunit